MPSSNLLSNKFVIKVTDHFDLGGYSLHKGGFTKSSKGSKYSYLEQNDTELILSRDINYHWPVDKNNLKQYTTERNHLFVDRTEKHSQFKLTERR